jgi:hypothetical protein
VLPHRKSLVLSCETCYEPHELKGTKVADLATHKSHHTIAIFRMRTEDHDNGAIVNWPVALKTDSFWLLQPAKMMHDSKDESQMLWSNLDVDDVLKHWHTLELTKQRAFLGHWFDRRELGGETPFALEVDALQVGRKMTEYCDNCGKSECMFFLRIAVKSVNA